MGRTAEDIVKNVLFCALGGNVVGNSKPTKAYMATSEYIPRVGEYFKCYRIEITATNSGTQVHYRETTTTAVQKVEHIAKNLYVITTRNSYYVTRVLSIPCNDVHFAVIGNIPKLNEHLKCAQLHYESEKGIYATKHLMPPVLDVDFLTGLYLVKTEQNQLFVCIPN